MLGYFSTNPIEEKKTPLREPSKRIFLKNLGFCPNRLYRPNQSKEDFNLLDIILKLAFFFLCPASVCSAQLHTVQWQTMCFFQILYEKLWSENCYFVQNFQEEVHYPVLEVSWPTCLFIFSKMLGKPFIIKHH